MIQQECERILNKFQREANYLAESSFKDSLDAGRYDRHDYHKGFYEGSAMIGRLAAIWLQKAINEIKEEEWPEN